ncbi:MAG: nucleotide exchange factor GrpE [Defluviicoccus sp.]|nr:nucleotide exchange factor GrpE [Defluviicoccus sp.]
MVTTNGTPNDEATAGKVAPGAAAAPAGAAEMQTAEGTKDIDWSEQLARVEAEVARLKDEYLRALAETENVRRRGARDREEASQYAVAGFARDMLAVADNLHRALGSVGVEARAADPALDALMSGVEMTERELASALERHGVKRIEAEGQLFDPHFHEALFEIPNAEVPNSTVLQVLSQGYTLNERILRPARVGVSRGGPKAAPAAALQADAQARARASAEAYEQPSEAAGGTAAGRRVDEQL